VFEVFACIFELCFFEDVCSGCLLGFPEGPSSRCVAGEAYDVIQYFGLGFVEFYYISRAGFPYFRSIVQDFFKRVGGIL